MLKITDKSQCCGCEACAQVCPVQCITMQMDDEGFRYPSVDTEKCSECGACRRVCPVLNRDEERQPLQTLAARNPQEQVRMQSSSGGVFSMLAERTLARGGVVFGARFDERWQVEHAGVESIEELASLRGSKYLQSRIGESFKRVREHLKAGREVMFSGTPCQIAGLRKFLRRDYDNLLTVDVVCHGVPSPLVWSRYLEWECQKHGTEVENLRRVSFRDKQSGWTSYSVLVEGAEGEIVRQIFRENLFMQGFLRNLYLRPSCHSCAARSGRSGSDITIGDFWGIRDVLPEVDDDGGITLLLINTDKGAQAIHATEANLHEVSYQAGVRKNPCLEQSVAIPKAREMFWREWQQRGVSAIRVGVRATYRKHGWKRLKHKIRVILRKKSGRRV